MHLFLYFILTISLPLFFIQKAYHSLDFFCLTDIIVTRFFYTLKICRYYAGASQIARMADGRPQADETAGRSFAAPPQNVPEWGIII